MTQANSATKAEEKSTPSSLQLRPCQHDEKSNTGSMD